MRREWCTKERRNSDLCRSRDMELHVDTHDFWLMHEQYCEDEKRADGRPASAERSPKSPRSTTRENRDRRERWTYGPREPRLPHHPEDGGWDRDNAGPGPASTFRAAEGETGPTRARSLREAGTLKLGSFYVWFG